MHGQTLMNAVALDCTHTRAPCRLSLPPGLHFDSDNARIVGTPSSTPPVFVSTAGKRVLTSSSTWRVVVYATDATGAVIPTVDMFDIELAGVLDMFRAVYAASNTPVNFVNGDVTRHDTAYAGQEYYREAPEDADTDGDHQTVALVNSVGKLFYNIQCPTCDAKNQSYSWLVAIQAGADGETIGGALKGTAPIKMIGEVYEGIQVVAQDEEHPRIILSNFTLKVDRGT